MPDIAFERVLPDTNVWLDAAFCPDSVARRALTILRAAGLPLYLEDLTEREAISVLNKRKLALGLTFDCRQYFLDFVSRMACIRVPPARPGIRLDHVRKHDQHIARAALHCAGGADLTLPT